MRSAWLVSGVNCRAGDDPILNEREVQGDEAEGTLDWLNPLKTKRIGHSMKKKNKNH
jgi:hypothetical protein